MHASQELAPLAGRERETGLLDAFVEQIGNSQRFLSLVGEAGVGKSVLWEHAVAVARSAKIRVLEARPAEREQDLAFAGLADILEGVEDSRVDALPDGQRRALQVAVFRTETVDDAIDPHLIGLAVLALGRGLTSEQPLLLAVDDVQWLDQASRAALAFALRRATADGQIGVLLSRRIGTGGGDDADLGLEVETIEVGALGLGATQQLLRERLGVELSRSVVQRIHERAAGNPLYAIELARALQDRGVTLSAGEELSVPRDLGLLLQERLRALPAETAEPLAAVAARGQPALSDVDTDLLEPAFRAGVIIIDRGRVRFSHPLLGAAAYAALPPNRLLALHQRLAEVIDDPEQQARHLALGSAGPNEEIAAALDRAAAAAADRGAPHAASELAEQAVRLTVEKQARVERVSAAAAFHIRAGDDVRARELLEEALADAEPGTPRARILRALGASHNYGVLERGFDYYKAALAEDDIDPRLHAEILAEYGWWAVAVRAEQSGEILQTAVSEAEALGDAPLLARSLAALAVFQFYSGGGVDDELVGRLLALQPQCEQMPIADQPVTRFGFMLKYAGQVERSRQLLARAVEIAERNGDSGVVEVYFLQCPVALYMGAWREGLEIANRVLHDGVESGREDMIAAGAAARAHLLAHLGDADGTRRDVETCRRYDPLVGANYGVMLGGVAQGLLELSLDRPGEALQLARDCAEEWAREGVLEPGIRTEFPVHAEAAIAVGELDEAEQLLDEIEQRAVRLKREWALACAARCRGLLAAARSNEQEAIEQFERALVEHERVEYRQFDFARTILCYGETLRRFKHRARARELIEQAIVIFDELEASLWAEKARRELARVSGRRAATGLTETEQRVADLVVAGRSNKEIAGELFVTVRTVESNLTRIYAKLGVHSRGELTARLRQN